MSTPGGRTPDKVMQLITGGRAAAILGSAAKHGAQAQMLLATKGGNAWRQSDYRAWLAEAGFASSPSCRRRPRPASSLRRERGTCVPRIAYLGATRDFHHGLLVSCNSDSQHKSRRAAPEWPGATREQIGAFVTEEQRRHAGCPARELCCESLLQDTRGTVRRGCVARRCAAGLRESARSG